jgi:signal transduction histidine kinase
MTVGDLHTGVEAHPEPLVEVSARSRRYRVRMAWRAVRAFATGPYRRDLLAAALFLLAITMVVLLESGIVPSALAVGITGDTAGVLAVVSSVVMAGVIAVQRYRPGVAVIGVPVIYAVINAPPGSLLIWLQLAAWFAVLYRLGTHASGGVIILTAVLTLVVEIAGVVWWGVTTPEVDAAIFVVPVLTGLAVRVGAHRWRSRGLAEQRRSWDEERQAVDRERARIARDLHDVVAHHLSGIVVSAGAAARVLDRDPAAARETLGVVAESARRTTDAMQAMLGALAVSGDAAPVGQPGLDDLDDLVEHFARGGCQVRVHTDGDLATVTPDAGLSAYRIVQECLTNALKHGRAGAVDVRIARTSAGLDLAVDDDGTAAGAPVPGSGNGLIGMAERVAVFGGTFTCGPTPQGGWSVRASLPLG